MMLKHYSPGIPVIINRKPENSSDAYIVFGRKFKKLKNHFNLSKKADLKEAAANLYKTIEKLKKVDIKEFLFLQFQIEELV